eukprot:9125195-Pyramimonas_sp.AAC.1
MPLDALSVLASGGSHVLEGCSSGLGLSVHRSWAGWAPRKLACQTQGRRVFASRSQRGVPPPANFQTQRSAYLVHLASAARRAQAMTSYSRHADV